MEDEILSQDIEEEEEDELSGLEEEEEEELKQTVPSKKVTKKTQEQSEEIKETYEAFIQPARRGIVNTLTGETMEGFEEKDQAIVNLAKVILNKLDKISIASGA